MLAPESHVQIEPGSHQPSFSVVIPAYQAADTVAGAVSSALEQTLEPLEILVVDDGSTDDITRVLEPLLDRITLLRQENGGRASARNVGVREARGEFVSFLDADDVYERERLEALAELARTRPDLDILMTDASLEVDGRVVGSFSAETPFATDKQRLAILERCFIACPSVRRSAVLAVGGFDESLRMGQDWDCWLRMIYSGSAAGLVDAPLYRYRIHDAAVTSNRPKTLRARVRLLEKAAARMDLTPEERKALHRSLEFNRARARLTEAEASLRRGDPDARRRTLAVALARSVGVLTRLEAVAAALAPGWAGRRLDAREARTGESRLRRRYPQ